MLTFEIVDGVAGPSTSTTNLTHDNHIRTDIGMTMRDTTVEMLLVIRM